MNSASQALVDIAQSPDYSGKQNLTPLTRMLFWLSPVAIAMPFFFLQSLAGFVGDYPLSRSVFFFATSWALHAVPILLVWGLTECIVAMARRQVSSKGSQAGLIAIAVARGASVMAAGLTTKVWLVSVGVPLPQTSLLFKAALLTACMTFAAIVSVRWPIPGRWINALRQFTAASTLTVVALLLFEAAASAKSIKRTSSDSQAPASFGMHRPDVVLVTIDALSAGHLPMYGYFRDTAPRLREFASGATTVEHLYAGSNWTLPTVASLIHGSLPWESRASAAQAEPRVVPEGNNLLRAFQDAGYTVNVVSTNQYASPDRQQVLPWVQHYRRARFLQFEAFIWRLEGIFPSLPQAMFIGYGQFLNERLQNIFRALELHTANRHFDPDVALDAARELWDSPHDGPRLLWVHLFPPHAPYATPKPFLGRFDSSVSHMYWYDSSPPSAFGALADHSFPEAWIGRYDESIAYVDSAVGSFFDWLKARGDFDQAIVVVTADHGESFHPGYGTHAGPRLFEDLIHIPFLIKLPNQKTAYRQGGLVSQIDIAPTMAYIAGLRPSGFIGRIVPIGHEDSFNGPVYSMNFDYTTRRDGVLDRGTVALLQGPYKYIHYYGYEDRKDIPPLQDELFDVMADPRESNNLAAIDKERFERLGAELLTELSRHSGALQAR